MIALRATMSKSMSLTVTKIELLYVPGMAAMDLMMFLGSPEAARCQQHVVVDALGMLTGKQ